MVDLNPYASPLGDLVAVERPSRWRDWVAIAALSCASIGPLIGIWEAIIGWPIPDIMANVPLQIVFFLVIFVLTMCSVPLAVVGLRSRYRICAGCALFFGSVLTAIIFYFKFYPILN
jgi:hypothetical protein